MSAINPRLSRQQSSLMARTRNRRDAPNVSERKSIEQRSLGRTATASVFCCHVRAYGPVVVSRPNPLRGRDGRDGRDGRVSCGSSHVLFVPAGHRSGDSQTSAVCLRCPSSLYEHQRCPAGGRAERSWDRHRQADTRGVARCRDPASPSALPPAAQPFAFVARTNGATWLTVNLFPACP